jgi:hypothetical protein
VSVFKPDKVFSVPPVGCQYPAKAITFEHWQLPMGDVLIDVPV